MYEQIVNLTSLRAEKKRKSERKQKKTKKEKINLGKMKDERKNSMK